LLSPPEDGVSLFVCSRSVLLARNRIVATIIIDCGFGRTCDQRKKTALLEIYRQTEWYVRPKRTWSYEMECQFNSFEPATQLSIYTDLTTKHAQGELPASAIEPEPATLTTKATFPDLSHSEVKLNPTKPKPSLANVPGLRRPTQSGSPSINSSSPERFKSSSCNNAPASTPSPDSKRSGRTGVASWG
jgi:hypothetical protein